MSVRCGGSSPVQPQNENRLTKFGKAAISNLTSFSKRLEILAKSAISKLQIGKAGKISGSPTVNENPAISKLANETLHVNEGKNKENQVKTKTVAFKALFSRKNVASSPLQAASKTANQSVDRKTIQKMAKELGLQGKEIKAFIALVRAPDSEKPKKMQELLALNPQIKASVRRTTKEGVSRVRFVVSKKAKLGQEGAHKACFRAIRVGGKFASKVKKVVTYEKATRALDKEFKNDAKQSVKMSEKLQAALDPEEKKLFIKYKLYEQNDVNLMAADFAEGGELFDTALSLSNEQLKTTTQRLLKAGHAMERNGFSHNDIKFENVFMKNGEAILGDLGFMQKDLTFNYGGTPGYIPPDLIDKTIPKGIPIRQDNFSIGVMLLCMYTGQSFLEYFDKPPKDLRSHISSIQKSLEEYSPQSPIIDVIRGLISADAKARISFDEALKILNGQKDVPLPDKKALFDAISKNLPKLSQ